MKKLLLVLLVFICSCCKNDNDRFIKNNEFISEPGNYYHKTIKIIVKEFKDGSLIYGIADLKNNIIYQQEINHSFSNNSRWVLYIDKNDNIWFHTSDLQLTSVLLKGNRKDEYVYKRINDNNTVPIPNEFKLKLK
ncbi:hypothetical protein PQ462_09845 [Flavobacterium sp. KACC 22758]|jgi:hypothetical protein|uniref:hypothetical protein n=1 Tax=Flavobacterium sp. KACC 22758 TaxID=3025667 RepID=UPI00236687A3|nr:hypothetical protein [Flavobacterium sp. KACC 22758]WDF61673.1 hypothetical protein PQ462_09845 [Flavobacterium sp. KACC 22758]